MTSAVSIITPTFNHAEFISECVESVRSQTVQGWEQFIVDDGSTDQTLAIAKTFDDPRIKVLPQKHRGIFRLAETYNIALRESRAPLVAVLEGDDVWRADFLEKMLPAFEDDDVVFAYAKALAKVNGRNQVMSQPMFETWSLEERTNTPIGAVLRPLLYFNGFPSACTFVFRRSVLEGIGGFLQPNQVPLVDYPTLLNVSLEGRFIAMDEPLAYWRRHAGQTMNRHARAAFWGTAEYAQRFYEDLPDSTKESTRLSLHKIKSSLVRQQGLGSFRQGRCELLEGRWAEARRDFVAAFRRGDRYVRSVSVLGWLASWARLNVEPVARLAGRGWYRTDPRH